MIQQVRPQSKRGLDDLQRQIEVARALFYDAENARALGLMEVALADLERVPVKQRGLWSTTAGALMLVAQLYKNLDRVRDSNEAYRRILRVEPAFQADSDLWSSRSTRALEAVRRDVRRSKKGIMQVATLGVPGASVFVDGREVGRTPLRLELPRGSYRLSLSSDDSESFPRTVKVDGEVEVQVDLAFEGSVRAQVPLCLTGEDDAAPLRLATTVGADRLVVLRSASQVGAPSYLTGVLYEVARGERVRHAGVRQEQLKDLMRYLFTGEPDLSSASSPGLGLGVKDAVSEPDRAPPADTPDTLTLDS